MKPGEVWDDATHVERLRIVPSEANRHAADGYFARSAIREYPVPDDFPPVVITAINVLAFVAFAVIFAGLAYHIFPSVVDALTVAR